MFNPIVTNGISHPYQAGESTFIFRGVRSNFLIFMSFFDEIHVRKAFCGVTPGAILFVYVP